MPARDDHRSCWRMTSTSEGMLFPIAGTTEGRRVCKQQSVATHAGYINTSPLNIRIYPFDRSLNISWMKGIMAMPFIHLHRAALLSGSAHLYGDPLLARGRE